MINLDNLKNESLEQIINTLAMASPFSLQEKQVLLETQNIIERKFHLRKEREVTYTRQTVKNI